MALSAAGHRPDLAVIGAGIVGLACAHELMTRFPGRRITVIDRGRRVASGQSGHNSGVVHSGVYYAPGSLKARLCVEGAAEMRTFCERHALPYERLGKLIVAADERELAALDEIERRAHANGVPDVRRIGRSQIGEHEPAVRGVSALLCRSTAVVDFAAVATKLAALLREGGVEIALGSELRTVGERGDALRLGLADGSALDTKQALFCAGLGSERLAVAAGARRSPQIIGFRGAYLRVRPERSTLVRSLVYPVPDPGLPFLGVHLTPTVAGELLIGPTALPAGAAALTSRAGRRMLWRQRRAAVRELRLALSRTAVVREGGRLVPGLTTSDLEPTGGWFGVRAQAVAGDGSLVDDFAFSHTPRALHVRNAPSPGATSAFAIARHVAGRIEL